MDQGRRKLPGATQPQMPLLEVYLPYQTDQLYCIILSLPPHFPSGPVGQLSSLAPLQLKETLEPAVKKQYLGD